MTDYNKLWTKKAESILLDRKIVKIRWLSKLSAEQDFGWYKRPIILTLDDGSEIIPQMDDEGNDGGALLWINPKETVESKAFPGEKFTKTEVLPVF
mgnify:FL=1|tara:strand:- start:7486 stop:7773 length:288 start_codon:yes stop_codon:yes gene_type:complete